MSSVSYKVAIAMVAEDRLTALQRAGGPWLELYLDCISGTHNQYQRLRRLTYPFDERLQALARYYSTRNVKLRIQQLYHDLQDWNEFGDRDKSSFDDNNFSLLHLLLMATLADDAPQTEFTELVDIIRRGICPAITKNDLAIDGENYQDMDEKEFHTDLCRRLDRLIRTSEDELVVAMASRLLEEATYQDAVRCHVCGDCLDREIGERMQSAIDSLDPDFHVDTLVWELAGMIHDAEEAKMIPDY